MRKNGAKSERCGPWLKWVAILCLTAFLVPMMPYGYGSSRGSGFGAAPAEAISFIKMLKIHDHIVIKLNITDEVIRVLIENTLKKIIMVAIHSLLTGQNPAEAIKGAIEGLGTEMVGKFRGAAHQAMNEVIGAIQKEISMTVNEVLDKMADNLQKTMEKRPEFRAAVEKSGRQGTMSNQGKRMFEGLPLLRGMSNTKGSDAARGGTSSTEDLGSGIPNGNPGMYTAVKDLALEKEPVLKAMKQAGIPATSMPSVMTKTAIFNAMLGADRNALESGAHNVGMEARAEMVEMIVARAAANSELKEALSRVADQESESTTVSNWTGGKSKAYKAWFDFQKSRFANHSRGTALILMTMQTLRAKDRMLSVVLGQKTQVYTTVVAEQIKRYNKVSDRELMRLMK